MKIAIIDTIGLTYDGNTLAKRGVGGSEAAVIFMSQALTKIGYDVTVVNNCFDEGIMPGIYNNVRHIHNETADQIEDTFDIVISSRSVFPFFPETRHKFVRTAKKRILWMHDTFCDGDIHIESLLLNGFIDEIFTLSDFHTTYVMNADHGHRRMFEVLKNKVYMTRNGTKKYPVSGEKDPDLFVYNASVTKGLEPLLQYIWPRVKQHIPNAKLTVIGGYYVFPGKDIDEQGKKLLAFKEDIRYRELDVHFTGIIKHDEVAQNVSRASFMIYPTAFPETFGISTLESLLYKTPVITCRFGALEETAIENASYLIDYPVVSNSLFTNINHEEQADKFVDLVIRAYNDKYLAKQKSEYCSIVDDIHTWDTVALQWNQHFHTLFNQYLLVSQYREVSRINDKVARVFGRRFSNKEEFRRYHSYGPQQKIVIISPFYNCEKYIENCILSTACQDYDNYVHYLIDDCSTDNTFNVAFETIGKLESEIRQKFVLKKNIENKGALRNHVELLETLKGDEIVILLDGDDSLVPNNTIFHMYNDLYYNDTEFSYGSCYSMVDNINLVAQEYPEHIKQSRSYRKHLFAWNMPYTHLRTFRANLFRDVDYDQFKNNDEWMKAGADGALFYAMIEKADPNKVKCIKDIIYNYNDINPLNDYKINSTEQTANATRILQYENHSHSNTDK